MRRVNLQVPVGCADRAREVADRVGGVNVVARTAQGEDGPVEVVTAHVPNDRVQALLAGVVELGDVRVTLEPAPTIPLRPPVRRAADELLDAAPRAPIEVLLAGLSSAGTWGSFLAFAAISGAVVATGLYTETVYLLTAAMLIAPFAGPAMNTALATAVGEPGLLRHAALRYAAAVATSAAVAGLVALVVGLDVPTGLMVSIGTLSPLAVVLPLAAGAAGALHLVQSERSSLVSGAAVGMLVAASLAPPAGIVGMGLVAGRPDLAGRGVFVLVLQLVGIHVVATLVFRWYRLAPGSRWVGEGDRRVLPVGLAITGLAVAGLLVAQFASGPTLSRMGVERQALSDVHAVIAASGAGSLADADIRFAPYEEEEPVLLAELHLIEVQEETAAQFEEEIRELLSRRYEVPVAVEVTAVEVSR